MKPKRIEYIDVAKLHIIRNVFYGIYFVNSKHQKIFIFGKIQKDPI